MVSWLHVSTIMVLVIFQIHLARGANEDCTGAVNNVEVVESCPTSKIEWDIAARRKNCSKLAAEAERNNCTMNEKQPEYHCLINALRNKLLEVCVAGKIIFGYCAEFNEAGKVIQNHYSAPCEDVSPKCDKFYRSSDAYKYPGCYELVNKRQVSTDVESGDPESGDSITKNIIATCIVAVVVLCLVAVTVLIKKCIRIRKKKRKREKDTEERHGFLINAEKTTNKGKAIKDDENKTHWEANPLFSFQDNLPLQLALETCHKESACHLILVKPVQDVADNTDDSFIVVDRNKVNILEALTSCLEQTLCNMLQEWLHLYSVDSVILGEVEALCKTRLNANNAIDPPKVPDDLKIYPSRRSDVEAYSMVTNSLLKVFVKKINGWKRNAK